MPICVQLLAQRPGEPALDLCAQSHDLVCLLREVMLQLVDEAAVALCDTSDQEVQGNAKSAPVRKRPSALRRACQA
ncbi:MAG: hypothetical protein ACXWIS_18710 [Burkholderiales bacterium]